MDDKAKEKSSDPSEMKLPPEGSTTQHELKLPKGMLAYRAVADWITLRKVHKPVAHVYHTAYIAEGNDGGQRPLTFVFNGGPGAASAYLHMGAVGPKRVSFGKMGSLPKPPTKVVDNRETWLAFSDVVFIDPVGTGFSRALTPSGKPVAEAADKKSDDDPKENPEFWEISRDLDSLGEFIARFLSRHQRWTSPIFIAGESYGGFRVAKMARRLQESHGVGLCGALLISPAIELETLYGSDYDLLYWVELFPSLAASAHHHGKSADSGADLEAVLRRAEAFAGNDLIRWLAQGEALPAAERTRIVKEMSGMTGIPAKVIERSGGRLTATLFCRELLRDERRLCGHYDASITAVDPFPDRNNYEGPDPTLFSIDRLFTGAINHHLRTNLKVDTELDYRLLSMEVNQKWKDKGRDHVFRKLTGAMDDLRYGMSLNEHMKIFVSHGHFDLVTPYFSSRRLLDLMKTVPAQAENIVVKNFHGGHMFYSWDESRAGFTDAVREFYAQAAPAR